MLTLYRWTIYAIDVVHRDAQYAFHYSESLKFLVSYPIALHEAMDWPLQSSFSFRIHLACLRILFLFC
jgi:hypothetical protein